VKPRFFLALVCLFLIALQSLVQAALRPAESDEFNGQEAPAFSVTSVKGDAVSLKDFKGRARALELLCQLVSPPCREEKISSLINLHEQYSKDGIAILGIAVDSLLTPESVGDVKPLAEKLAIPYPVAIATEQIAKDYHFKDIPTTVVIDKDGKIAKTFYGYHDDKVIEAAVQELLAATESKTQ
jgi:peroxiredoxin